MTNPKFRQVGHASQRGLIERNGTVLVERKKLESLTRLKLPLYYKSLGDFQLRIIM